MGAATIASLRCRTLRINAATHWTIIELACSDGIVGHGEASANGSEAALRLHAAALAERLQGVPALPNALRMLPWKSHDGLARQAVLSAVEQALWDAQGQRLGVPVQTLLGGAISETVPVYANINRRTRDRSPDGFAESAHLAVAAGFDFVKLAPFDNVGEASPLADEALLAAGLARIAAVGAALGDAARIMVDCHWRLDESAAIRVLDFAAEHALFWVECPVRETQANLPVLRRLRGQASARGVRLAGMEKGLSLAEFRPPLEEAIYDVLMPDVKYCGGLAATRAIADLAATADIRVAPHNPTGPVCHAASLAVSATMTNCLVLEMQFQESPLFEALTGQSVVIRDGRAEIPRGPGLGLRLDADLVAEIEVA